MQVLTDHWQRRVALVEGCETDVVTACLAHDQVAARYPGEALPHGKTVEEKAAVSRWWAADRAAEMAAFVAWPVHPREAWFEVGVGSLVPCLLTVSLRLPSSVGLVRLLCVAREGAYQTSHEPPTADPHGGWCGGRRLAAVAYPIRRHCVQPHKNGLDRSVRGASFAEKRPTTVFPD